MNQTHKTVFRWWWAWADEAEERWLEGMARQGWHLDKIVLPCVYRFQAGEPRHDVYRLDFVAGSESRAEYFQLFQDAGWQHLGQEGGWQYFRKTVPPGEKAEIYTDNASKLTKYRRLAGVLVIFIPILISNLVITHRHGGWPWAWIMGFQAGALFLLAVALVRIGLRIRELKKS